ncbi:hypothetical protein TIFTF001_021371 [Ficus carica]|uniref:Uncharacterized protein n=1 Tax=Ficus carica TaxID=3494 RepID=A0AA88AHD3_FICCA|nr:hypothetical protein TIFTF001_021371 [Ficus carica]
MTAGVEGHRRQQKDAMEGGRWGLGGRTGDGGGFIVSGDFTVERGKEGIAGPGRWVVVV